MNTLIQRKEYLPGYTGHVSQKQNIIGCTEGEIGRQLSQKSFKYTNADLEEQHIVPPNCEETMRQTMGNNSRKQPTWIGGHTQDLKPQHIPGYQGHVPGINSENMHAKGFGQLTAAAIAKEQLNEDRFQTSYKSEMNEDKFRRLHDLKEREKLDKKDQEEYDRYFEYFGYDLTELYTQPTEERAIDLLPTSGYKGFKSRYRTSLIKKQNNNPLHNFNVGPLTAKLKNTNYEDVTQNPQYQTLSKGFQQTMTKTQ